MPVATPSQIEATLSSFSLAAIPEAERSIAENLAALDYARRSFVLNSLDEDQARSLAYDWNFWARPDQQEPEAFRTGEAEVWAIRAGRGYGKTRTGAETTNRRAKTTTTGRLAIVAPTAGDARDILIEGESGILTCSPPWDVPHYEPSKRRVTWSNGATATVFSADEPDRLRGPQFEFVWGDEPACLPAGTLVETEEGPRPVEAIAVGTQVWTRRGLRRVRWAGPTRPDAELVEIVTSSGRRLRATPDHLVASAEGWVPAGAVAIGDSLAVWENSSSTARPPGSPGGAAATTGRARTTTRTGPGSSSTGTSSRPSSATQAPTTSIIGTKTRPTTGPRISNGSTTGPTPTATGSPGITPDGSHRGPRRPPLAAPRRPGRTESLGPSPVPSAGDPSRLPGCGRSSAPPPVGLETVVDVVACPRREQTYDLAVEDCHEFVANGIVVHNSWRYGEEAWDNIEFGLRLGPHPQALLTGTPKPIKWLKDLWAESKTVVTTGASYRNLGNLAPSFIRRILAKYEGTRLGLQELHAVVLEDVEGALWTRKTIERGRWKWDPDSGLVLPDFDRVVVAVDPAVSTGPDSDATGIIVAGREGSKFDGRVFVLEDLSIVGSPEEWGSAVIDAYHRHEADRVVAEKNNGGDLVSANLRAIDRSVPVDLVWASRGKKPRAEPVATLYETTIPRVHHVGVLAELEEEMTEWVPGETDDSPDRVDALVWAVTDLLDLGSEKKKRRVRLRN